MKKIQNPTPGQALSQAFGLQGRVQPSLDEVIVPTVQLADLGQNQPPDLTGNASAYFFQSATVGQSATARFEVPPNVIAQIRAIYVRSPTAARFSWKIENPGGPQASQAPKGYTDGRVVQAGLSPAGVLTYGTQAAFLANAIQWVWAPTTGLVLRPYQLVIGSGVPGQFGFLEMQYRNQNVDVEMSLEWTEWRVV